MIQAFIKDIRISIIVALISIVVVIGIYSKYLQIRINSYKEQVVLLKDEQAVLNKEISNAALLATALAVRDKNIRAETQRMRAVIRDLRIQPVTSSCGPSVGRALELLRD